MKKSKRLLRILLCGSLIFSLSGCNMIEQTSDSKQKTVVARIQDKEITLKDLDTQIAQNITKIKQKYNVDNISKSNEAVKELEQNRSDVLDVLVKQEIFQRKAKELKLVPSNDDLNNQVEEHLKALKEVWNKSGGYDAALKENNHTETKLKEELKKSIISNRVSENIINNVKVSEKDAKDYYDSHKQEMYTKSGGADMYHILVSTEDKAKEIKTKLDNGAKFADLAKEYGTDESRTAGGSLGYFEYDSKAMDQDFLNAAKFLKEGQISNPVKTQFGYHIIMVKNIKEQSLTPFDEVKKEIETTLLQKKQKDAVTKKIEEWKKEFKVTENKDNLKILY